MFRIGQDFAAHCTFFAPNLLYGSGWDGETVKKSPHHSFHFVNVIALIVHAHTQRYIVRKIASSLQWLVVGQ